MKITIIKDYIKITPRLQFIFCSSFLNKKAIKCQLLEHLTSALSIRSLTVEEQVTCAYADLMQVASYCNGLWLLLAC